jgi:hypothetical protein
MRAISDWFGRSPRCQTRAHAAARYKPRLETLEKRQLLSFSPTGFGSEFIRYNDGELFLHDSGGFHRIDMNVASVSSGFSLRGDPIMPTSVPVAFIVYNNARLFEWAQDTGFTPIDRNVVGVAGSQLSQDTAFILYNNAQLFQHSGTSPLSGFTFIAGAVTTMSPNIGGNGDVFYVQTNHILSEHLTAGGSVVIDGNVQSVTAGRVEVDSAFILYTNGALFLFNPRATQQFTRVDTNVASAAASVSLIPGTGTDIDSVYYVTQAGVLVEWVAPFSGSLSTDGTYVFLDSNVASISTSLGLDDVFIVYNNDMLFEHTGFSRQSGFTFIDSNVSP